MDHIRAPRSDTNVLDDVIEKIIDLARDGRRITDHQLTDTVRRSLRFTGKGIIELYETKWRHGVRTEIFEQIVRQLNPI